MIHPRAWRESKTQTPQSRVWSSGTALRTQQPPSTFDLGSPGHAIASIPDVTRGRVGCRGGSLSRRRRLGFRVFSDFLPRISRTNVGQQGGPKLRRPKRHLQLYADKRETSMAARETSSDRLIQETSGCNTSWWYRIWMVRPDGKPSMLQRDGFGRCWRSSRGGRAFGTERTPASMKSR